MLLRAEHQVAEALEQLYRAVESGDIKQLLATDIESCRKLIAQLDDRRFADSTEEAVAQDDLIVEWLRSHEELLTHRSRGRREELALLEARVELMSVQFSAIRRVAMWARSLRQLQIEAILNEAVNQLVRNRAGIEELVREGAVGSVDAAVGQLGAF